MYHSLVKTNKQIGTINFIFRLKCLGFQFSSQRTKIIITKKLYMLLQVMYIGYIDLLLL